MVLPQITVLLVEDDPGDARLLRSALAGPGMGHHAIEHVTSLTAAKARIAQDPLPEVLLLDLTLPDSSGHATFDELFEVVGSRIPIVILTGLDDDIAAATAVESGAQDYLVKGSLSGPSMVRAIRHAIERNQLQVALQERIKERAGLFAVGQTLQSELPAWEMYAEIARHLAAAMRFPTICSTTVTVDGATEGADPDPGADLAVIRAPITVDGVRRGQIVASYREPHHDFLIPEEEQLLTSAADAIGGWLARQDAAQRLVRDGERLRMMVSQLPGVIWTTDGDLRVTSHAGAALARLEIGSQELVDRPLADLLETDPPGQTLAMLETALAGGSVDFDGPWRGRWWRNRVEPKTDPDGRVVGTVCLTMDITTERQQQAELDAAHQRFLGLFINTTDAMILADDDGTYIDANPAAAVLTGYDADEIPGMSVSDLTPRDHQVTPDVALGMWREFLADGTMAGEFPIRRKDGTIVETEFRAVANIAPTVHLSTMRDITERKQAERQLAASEARFRNIAESSRDGICLLRLTPELAFDYVSPAVETITGFSPQAVYDDPARYLERVTPDEGDPVAQALTAPDAVPSVTKIRFRHAAGHWIWLEDHHSVLTEEGQPVAILGRIQDISAREDAEQALRDALRAQQEAMERLQAVDDLKSSFLQAVSHELRTPLTSVLGYAHTLMSGKLTPEQTDDFHRRLVTNATRLDVLLGDLLDVERLNRGVVRLNLQATDLAALTASVAADIDLADRDLIIERTPTIALVDTHQAERMLHNLLANAAKHTPAGSTIWVSFENRDDSTMIIVSDDGPGIPGPDREHVFEPFWQAPSMRSTASPGTGIGLALVRQLATLHGGRAWVESRDGGGASFHITLPTQAHEGPATASP